MRRWACILLVAIGTTAAVGEAAAQQAPGSAGAVQQGARGRRISDNENSLTARMNANTVSVVSGTPGGTYFRMAADLAFVLDDGEEMRVLPILGKGAGQNAYDIRFLKGVDIGFVRTDTLEQLRKDTRLSNPQNHLAYIARLFNDELHIVARRDITNVQQLAGKKVSFDVKGSGSDYSGRAMFEGLGVPIEAVNVDQPTAFDRLSKGELDAVVSVAAKPVAVVASFDPGDRFHLVDAPFPEQLADRYFPATVSQEDYPKLVEPGRTVSTVAVGTVLGVYNWPERTDRYRRIARFIDAFFDKFPEFLKPARHPKWREVNLAATIPQWQRFKAAQQWLDRHPAQPAVVSSTAPRQDVQVFFSTEQPSDNISKERLFEEFTRWRRATARP